MFNLFRRPIKKETLDAWAKALEDLAKLAVVGAVALVYSPDKGFHSTNIFTVLFVCIVVYSCLSMARVLRDNEDELTRPKGGSNDDTT